LKGRPDLVQCRLYAFLHEDSPSVTPGRAPERSC
jgi:hypothetical protein